MRVLVYSRIDELVVVVEILVMEKNLSAVGLVESVHFFAFFTRHRDGKVEFRVLELEKERLYLVLIH